MRVIDLGKERKKRGLYKSLGPRKSREENAQKGSESDLHQAHVIDVCHGKPAVVAHPRNNGEFEKLGRSVGRVIARLTVCRLMHHAMPSRR